MHIVSGVQGKLAEDRDAFDLIAAAFPAGTLVELSDGMYAVVVGPSENARAETEVFGSMAGTAEILGDIVEPVATDDWEALR